MSTPTAEVLQGKQTYIKDYNSIIIPGPGKIVANGEFIMIFKPNVAKALYHGTSTTQDVDKDYKVTTVKATVQYLPAEGSPAESFPA
jgi:hypothetical protein